MNRLKIFFILFILYSCHSPKSESSSAIIPVKQQEIKDSILNIDLKLEFEQDSIMNLLNLVDVQSIDSSIQIDLKYASADNFMKQKLYHKLTKLYLQKDVAERIAKSQVFLKSIHPNYSLLIYDGVRPVEVQQRMWDALDTIPVAERGRFVSNPKNHSVHNYGAAVDLTIVDEQGIPLDMGAGYDDIRKIAYPSLEAQFLASGELTEKQINNRKLLRKVMQNQGFINIPSEWWHFNAYTRNEVKKRYKILEKEPE